MPRFYCMMSMAVVVALSICVGASLMPGAARPPIAALEGFEGCAFPCWYGIALDRAYDDYEQRLLPALAAVGYEEQSVQNDDGGYTVTYVYSAIGRCDVEIDVQWHMEAVFITLTHCPDVRLGDLMAVIGSPSMIAADGTEMRFDSGGVSVRAGLQSGDWVSWFTPVTQIQMATDGAAPFFCAYTWVGMQPRWLYYQMQWDDIREEC